MLKPRLRGNQPLRVALLTSSRAPGLGHLLDQDPDRGRLYQIVVGVVTDPEAEAAELERARIPRVVHDLRAFCRERGGRVGDLDLRRLFDGRTLRSLQSYRPDLVVLSGYLHILTAPMLEAFPNAILNVHDADLAILGPDGKPRYRGLRSTFEALAGGEPETRSSVHLVTPELDVGPLLVRSEGFPVHPLVTDARRWGAADVLKAYAYAQREWMMRASWGRLLAKAISLFGLGQVRILDGRAAVDGRLGPVELLPAGPALERAVMAK